MADSDTLSKCFNTLSVSNSGYVYLVVEENENDPNGPLNYKIGQSEDPEKRLPALQTGNPRKLRLLLEREVNDMRAAEKSAKEALKEYNTWRRNRMVHS